MAIGIGGDGAVGSPGAPQPVAPKTERGRQIKKAARTECIKLPVKGVREC